MLQHNIHCRHRHRWDVLHCPRRRRRLGGLDVLQEGGLAPLRRITGHTALHRLRGRVARELVLAVLPPVDKEVAGREQTPVAVRRVRWASEVIEPIRFKLHLEGSPIVCEVPLGACAVAEEQGLDWAQRPQELGFAPVGRVADAPVGRVTLLRAVRGLHELILAKLLPVDLEFALMQQPDRRSLIRRAKEGPSGAKRHLECTTLVANSYQPSKAIL